MDQIAILFPSKDAEVTEIDPQFLDEYKAVEQIPQFLPVLYNEQTFAKNSKLKVSKIAPVKTMFCIRRGRVVFEEQSDTLRHSLKRLGYRPAIKIYGGDCGSWPNVDRSHFYTKCAHKPDVLCPYNRYEKKTYYSSISWGIAWFPDIDVVNKFMPAIFKTLDGVVEDENGRAKIFTGKLTWEEFESIMLQVCDVDLDDYIDTTKHAPMWLEQIVEIEEINGVPCEWRVFCYAGKVFYMTPKFHVPTGIDLPRPNMETIKKELRTSGFRAIDFALDKNGKWWVLKNDGAEVSKIPNCASVFDFYKNLSEVIQKEEGIPEFCHALVADIVEEHTIGYPPKTVQGSRHFKSGETVVYADGFWGMGVERSTVIGVPKYSDYPVAVSIGTHLLTNFRVEKITDKRFLKAMFTGKLQETFEKERKTFIEAEWMTPKCDLEKLNEMADMFNKSH